VATIVLDTGSASSAHTAYQSLDGLLLDSVPLSPQCLKQLCPCPGPANYASPKLIPQVLYGIQVRGERRPLHGVDVLALEKCSGKASSMGTSVVMLKGSRGMLIEMPILHWPF